ncbi:[FeFe] hydrogenase H-cluster radical SAM maturase HydE [Bacteroides sp. 224]|uniref:[FeFe] hydrogenase H-cluster radical SAM maturase HydE n=1 Tax=Bacteroides sp. 224 TaxID=2302936 RepID=UPI0013D0D4AE|nr:[FeFe] hydrogenase H-cluster radical SAM maturase HydE [Bacteroides sp. 224]NDV66615.1 [FeFe] hydrogenase H-cluster radical SAM maturase HydE [Bacteroides sp. 224]
MKELVKQLLYERHLERAELVRLLSNFDQELLSYINDCARSVTITHFGKAIYLRGLIELTNFCRNNCFYCGIRASNRNIERYRLMKEQVLNCCRLGDHLKVRTFVLQGGEDLAIKDFIVEDLIKSIHREFPYAAITLSLGERSQESYQAFYEAGATRYLLRHEAANRDLYNHLHPDVMSYDNRIECLHTLKKIGFQTGAGMMIGSPGQTIEHLVDDILFLEELNPQMIGMGPYIPQRDTPFASEAPGSVLLTLMLISIVRLMFPKALIPATTALATQADDGYEKGILAGANVIMPNLLPIEYKTKYSIYDNKEAVHQTTKEQIENLKKRIDSIGYFFSENRGDYEP